MKRAMLVAILVAVGCTTKQHDLGQYTFFSAKAATTAAGQGQAFGPFTVPAAAAVEYAITDRTTSSTSDHWDVGVTTPSELTFLQAGQQWQAYGAMSGVSTTGASIDVPAGDYYFAVVCDNVIDDCVYSVDVSAVY